MECNQIRNQHLQIDNKLHNAEYIEQLMCPGCKQPIDLSMYGHTETIKRFLRHSNNCVQEQVEFKDNFLWRGRYVLWGENLKPVTAPTEPWSKPVEEIYRHLEASGWSVEVRRDEEVVIVMGLRGERYTVTESGEVYGDGAVKELIHESLKKI